jgi:hypothetical protein
LGGFGMKISTTNDLKMNGRYRRKLLEKVEGPFASSIPMPLLQPPYFPLLRMLG